MELRNWQQQALTLLIHDHLNGVNKQIYFIVAGVGSGKTTFSCVTTKRLFDLKFYSKAFFVSPQRSVRQGFVNTAAKFGMQLNYVMDSAYPEVIFDQFDGVAVTYAGLNSLSTFQDYIDEDTIIILDEPHHLAENKNRGTTSGWYDSALKLFKQAGLIILMTGTPYRSDEDETIPFATYKQTGLMQVLQSDYYYSYGQAVRDGVVAECKFIPCYGRGMYIHGGIEYAFDLEAMDPNEDEPKVLKTLLEPSTDFVAGMINQAVRKLEEIRTEENNYGGLIVAKDKHHARQIYDYMVSTYGLKPALVLNDEGDGLKIINQFQEESRKWIIAIKMVSEGTDIPRLKVCCYLSNVRTMLFFVQVKGRIVRKTIPGPEYAYLYYPAVQSFRNHIKQITKDVTDTFTAREIKAGVAPERNPSYFEALEASFSGEVDFSICDIELEPVVVKSHRVLELRKNIAELARVYADLHIRRKQLNRANIGTTIANIHRKINNDMIGVEHQEDMTLEELQQKCDILLSAIEKLREK